MTLKELHEQIESLLPLYGDCQVVSSNMEHAKPIVFIERREAYRAGERYVAGFAAGRSTAVIRMVS